MTKGTIRDVALRIAAGSAAALLITWGAYRFHLNLSSATSIHLFLVTAIALRWGFIEASIVSLLSVACLDYFFTQPLFVFYMTDVQDWVALFTFEAVALLVSRLSNQSRQHVREAERSHSQVQKLYDLSQNILLLDRNKPVEQELASLIQSTFAMGGVALWNAQELQLAKSGDCSEITDDEVCSTNDTERIEDDAPKAISQRGLRLGTRSIGSL